VAGDHLLAAGRRGLTVLDVSDRPRLRQLAHLDTNPALEVVLAGDRAYLRMDARTAGSPVAQAPGVQIVDIRRPAEPKLLGSFPVAELASIAAGGSRVFAGIESGGIVSYAAENPAAVRRLGVLKTPERISALLLDGNCLYAGDAKGGVLVVDVANPAAPRVLGSAGLPWHLQANSWPRRLERVGSTLLMAGGNNGLLVYDVADPAQPRLLSSVPVRGFARDLSVSGHLVTVIGTLYGPTLIDIADPERPQIVAAMSAPDVVDAVQIGDWICLTGQEDLTLFPRPVAARKIDLHSGRLEALFPPPPAAGSYALHVSDGRRSAVFPAAVTVGGGSDREIGR
jgi:hypothetical protein